MNAANYSLSKKGETEMLDCLFNKHMTVNQTVRELEKMGISKTQTGVIKFKQDVMNRIMKSDKAEFMMDYILDSSDRAKIEFNDLMEHTKKLLKQAEEENKPMQQLEFIKEIRAQIETALKRQGELSSTIKQSITNIQNNQGATTSELMEQMEKIKINWFKTSGAELVDDKIVFNNPPAEMIDLFKKWKFSEEFSRAKVIDVGEQY